jgi:uncharacterized protein (TIGR00255 family)
MDSRSPAFAEDKLRGNDEDWDSMIRSMTGYSKAQAEEGGYSLSVSLRGTNHRFLDVQVLRFPSALESMDHLLRRLIKKHIKRGHVEVTVSFQQTGNAGLLLDRKLLAAYLAAYRTLQAEFGSSSEPDLVALLRVPGLATPGNGEISPEDFERLRQLLERVTTEALEGLNEMREREGEDLGRDLKTRLARLESLTDSVARLTERLPKLYQQRLEGRLRELLGSIELDGARLAEEVAYLASRSDTTEELTRFRSHVAQVKQLFAESPEVGKKLDFLLQEMNREANTLLSKTTDLPEVGLEVARLAIEMKSEIEKLREQAQNIE